MSDDRDGWGFLDKGNTAIPRRGDPFWHYMSDGHTYINVYPTQRSVSPGTGNRIIFVSRTTGRNVFVTEDALPAELRNDVDALKRYALALWRMS